MSPERTLPFAVRKILFNVRVLALPADSRKRGSSLLRERRCTVVRTTVCSPFSGRRGQVCPVDSCDDQARVAVID